MNVTVKFFAMCREAVGLEHTTLDLDDAATGREFWEAIIRVYPQLTVYRESSRLAVNQEYVADATPLSQGDEVCIIPPVSGG